MREAKTFAILIVLTFVTVIIVCFSNARADYAQSRFNYTWDSDDVTTTEFLAGYAIDYNKWSIGAMQGIKKIKDNDGSTTFHETVVTFEGKPSPILEISGSVGTAYKSSYTELIGDVLITYNPPNPSYWEFSYYRNVMESTQAINAEISSDALFISGDYQFNDRWTINGILGGTFYSDGNKKWTESASLIFNILEIPGLYLKGTGKWEQSDKNPAEYFSPEDKVQYLFGPGYVKYFDKYDIFLRASYQFGKQNINNNEWEDADLLKINVEKPVTKNSYLDVGYVYTTDGGESDYKWEGIFIKFTWSF